MHALPTRTNPRLAEVKSRQVKLQVIRREDKEIIIGRIKLPTVNGAEHGFLLKRFDTNAIAGSSMFRLAFPYADGEEESAEMAYLESRFDTNVANGGTLAPATPRRGRKPDPNNAKSNGSGVLPPGSTGVRLQGVWIPCEQAAPIAEDYGLLELAQPLLEATAVLLPNDDVPLLNPDADTLAVNHHDAETALDYAACIGCGACVAACPNGAAHLFTGAKLKHLKLLPLGKQERSRRARKMVDELETNFGHCSLYGECADVCPAGIPLDAVGAINAERARAAFKGGDD